MIIRIFFIFYFFSSVALADDSSASELLNKVLKKNYHFIEKSLDQSELKIGTSSGKIFHDDSGMTVKVLAPLPHQMRRTPQRVWRSTMTVQKCSSVVVAQM